MWTTAALAACQALAISPESEAILVQPTDATRAELQLVVARILNAPSVTVADDVLTGSSLMIIEKVRPRDARGVSLTGRDFDKPEQFRLLKIGDQCILNHVRTGVRELLRESRCEPVGKR